MTNQHIDWRPHELELAEKAWRAGHSASEIARQLPGRTRSGVIGIAHRKGWIQQTRAKPSAPAKAPPAPKPPRAPKAKAESAKPRGAHRTAPRPGPQHKPGAVFGKVSVVGAAETAKIRIAAQFAGLASIQKSVEQPGPNAVSLMNRRTFQCSWPVGSPDRLANQMCCGEPVPANTHRATPTYCLTHGTKALSKLQPSARISPPRERRAA